MIYISLWNNIAIIIYMISLWYLSFYINIFCFLSRFSTGKPTVKDLIFIILLQIIVHFVGICLGGTVIEGYDFQESSFLGGSENNSSSNSSGSSMGGSSYRGSLAGSDGHIPEEETPIPSHFSDWGTSSGDLTSSSGDLSTSSGNTLPRSKGSMNLRADAGISLIPKSTSSNYPTTDTVKIELLPSSKWDNFFNIKKN